MNLNREEIIDSTTPLAGTITDPPLIVVGLPRSGSSYLARLLSKTGDWFVFDDFYLRRNCLNYSNPNELADQDLKKISDFLFWTLHSRLKFHTGSIPHMTLDEARMLSNNISTSYQNQGPAWHQIHREFLVRLTLLNQSHRWGWKCPSDIRVLNQLFEVFPGSKSIFLHRNPIDQNLSKKYVHGQDGDPRQYHIIANALQWSSAWREAESILAENPNDILFVSFKDLVNDPISVQIQLREAYVSQNISADTKFDANTSFDSSEKPTPSYIEYMLIRTICRKEILKSKYDLNCATKGLGISSFIIQTFVFTRYQLMKCLQSKAWRVTVQEYLRSITRS